MCCLYSIKKKKKKSFSFQQSLECAHAVCACACMCMFVYECMCMRLCVLASTRARGRSGMYCSVTLLCFIPGATLAASMPQRSSFLPQLNSSGVPGAHCSTQFLCGGRRSKLRLLSTHWVLSPAEWPILSSICITKGGMTL